MVAAHQIFKVCAHRPAEPEVMILTEQMVEERFPFGTPDQLDVQKTERRQGPLDRRGIAGFDWFNPAMRQRVIGRRLSFGRKDEVSGSMQEQQQAAADHVPRLAVGLHPMPSLTHFKGEPTATQAGVLRDQLAQQPQVGLTNLSAAIAE